jgi:hypothetical protein
MKMPHWGIIIAVLLVGYLVGVKFPSTGQSLLSKVGV